MAAIQSGIRKNQPFDNSIENVDRNARFLQFLESPWPTVAAAAVIVGTTLIVLSLISTVKRVDNDVNLSLTRNTYAELVDWHTSGPFMFRCPVAWIRVRNYNSVPIKELVFHYTLYDQDGNQVDHGKHTITEEIAAGRWKNFFEQYFWFTSPASCKLQLKLVNVKAE